jgi:hypothetical protein
MPKAYRPQGKTDRGIAAPIAVALAAKVVALAILYFVFFVPASPPTADHTASTVFGIR